MVVCLSATTCLDMQQKHTGSFIFIRLGTSYSHSLILCVFVPHLLASMSLHHRLYCYVWPARAAERLGRASWSDRGGPPGERFRINGEVLAACSVKENTENSFPFS